jgi:SAM-dependent MidA family methyltransferase
MPERFDHYMARANAAYYAAHNPFADFTTAPEISQIFGEICGAWAKIAWTMLGGPEDIIFAEAGPGRGTLMADALRAWPNPAVHFIETSPRLRAEQAERVPNAIWHGSLSSIPHQPLILIANEFLDALPVRQFIRAETGWMERHVENAAYLDLPTDHPLPNDPPGSIREINEPAIAFIQDLACRNAVALIIDYGHAQSAAGSSVQAIAKGRPADPLQNPGNADITAHVDFSSLAAAALAAGADVQGPVKQNAFLTACGLFQRSDALAQRHPARAGELRRAADRLTAPEAMGSLFKVLALCPKGFPTCQAFHDPVPHR